MSTPITNLRSYCQLRINPNTAYATFKTHKFHKKRLYNKKCISFNHLAQFD